MPLTKAQTLQNFLTKLCFALLLRDFVTNALELYFPFWHACLGFVYPEECQEKTGMAEKTFYLVKWEKIGEKSWLGKFERHTLVIRQINFRKEYT